MANTSRWGLPYPVGANVPDVPLWMNDLAVALDDHAKDDQGLLVDRPVSTPAQPGQSGRYYFATDVGALDRDHGTGWTRFSPVPPIVDALPTTGLYDGLTVRYRAATGVLWTLVYDSSIADAYKWVCIGGKPLRSFNGPQFFATSAYLGAYQAQPSDSLAVPLAGNYGSHFGAQIGVSGGTLGQSGYVGAAKASETSPTNGAVAAHGEEQHTFVGGTSWASVTGTGDHASVPAASAIRLLYTAGGSVTSPSSVSWSNRWLEVMPQRVG